jgi:hypothetical protein
MSYSRTVLFTEITAVGVDNNCATQCDWVLFGLDNKGRIWKRTNQHGWERMEHPAVLPDEDRS